MPAVYSLLCGMLIYVAILAFFGRRMFFHRWSMVLGSLSLAVSFAMLALITAGVLQQLDYAFITRMGFAGYGVSLAVIIVQYWVSAWREK